MGSAVLVFNVSVVSDADHSIALELSHNHNETRLLLIPPADGISARLGVRLQRSTDLRKWVNTPLKLCLEAGTKEAIQAALADEDGCAFYRAFARPQPSLLGTSSAEVFGYAAEFEDALAAVGAMTIDEFKSSYGADASYLPQLTWDVSTARYYQEFISPPNPRVVWTPLGSITLPDFSPNDVELDHLKRNGFVVSARWTDALTFGRAYYGIYIRDLPVFVTTDSILHAWHRSYDSMLAQLEESYMYDALGKLLALMAEQVPNAVAAYGQGVLADSVRDADYFLAVGRSLLSGSRVDTYTGNDALVGQTLNAIAAGEPAYFDLFGRMQRGNESDARNLIDFSLFKVRGHYVDSVRLQRYFRAMIWCGHIDLRIAGNPEEASPRELGTAIVLNDLLQRSGARNKWQGIEQIVRCFVGTPDSLDFDQLQLFLSAAGIDSPAQISSITDLESLQEKIEDSSLGAQLINAHGYEPMDHSQRRLPRSFTVLGQRFVPDSWTTSEIVYDRLKRLPNGYTRRIPSALDVAFAVFANDSAAPMLADRMLRIDGMLFRDGYLYHRNLAALRMVFDSITSERWQTSLYMAWLDALRALSIPTTSAIYPEAMRTRAWAMKTLNTQIGSWTQLRHDTIAYVKQSASTPAICSYPAGFVEPLPEFYARMEKMARGAAQSVSAFPMEGELVIQFHEAVNFAGNIDLGNWRNGMVKFLVRFADTVATLKGIATKELLQQPLSDDENRFLRSLVEVDKTYAGTILWTGWYPRLFYRSNDGLDPRMIQGGSSGGEVYDSRPVHDVDLEDIIVADVHTDYPDLIAGDPGCVLHEGIGRPYMLLIAIDNGPDRMMYAGPVFSHFEFVTPFGTRLNDAEWKERLSRDQPQHPEWTREYLVPAITP